MGPVGPHPQASGSSRPFFFLQPASWKKEKVRGRTFGLHPGCALATAAAYRNAIGQFKVDELFELPNAAPVFAENLKRKGPEKRLRQFLIPAPIPEFYCPE